jgi:membrane dipeptidase
LIERKAILFIIGGIVVGVCVSLAIALPLTLSKSGETKQAFRGSEVLDEVPLIDGHNDLPWNLYNVERNQLDGFNLDANLKLHPTWSQRSSSHTDLPRLREGKLGAQFWVAYVGCNTNYKDAMERTIEQIDVTKRIIAKYPNDLKFVTDADGIMEAFAEGKIGSLICVEGGHSIDSRLSALRVFYELGARYMTLTHSCDTPWADASPIDDADVTVVRRNLTEFGKQVVLEMNRLGMMVDLSHVSHGVMNAALDITRAPVIFSHSESFSVNAHHRNVRDDILEKLVHFGWNLLTFYCTHSSVSTESQRRHYNGELLSSFLGWRHIGEGGRTLELH